MFEKKSFPLFFEIQPVSRFSRFPILIGNTADQRNEVEQKWLPKSCRTERKQTVFEHFSLSNGSYSSLVLFTNEPDFLRKKAVPQRVFFGGKMFILQEKHRMF